MMLKVCNQIYQQILTINKSAAHRLRSDCADAPLDLYWRCQKATSVSLPLSQIVIVSPATFKTAFNAAVTDTATGGALRAAALDGQLGAWTRHLTATCVNACRALELRASARGHKHDLLPVARSEYLSLDVVAFREENKHWVFPSLVAELENQTAFDFIAYSLWKVLCVTANLRLVFCYRKYPEEGPELISRLRREVVAGLGIDGRIQLVGETVVVVGSRNDAETFPYGFFNWWVLDCATGQFSRMT